MTTTKKVIRHSLTLLLAAMTVTAEAKDKPASPPVPTSNPAAVVATAGGKTLTWGDLQILQKFSGSPAGQDQNLINMWKVNAVLAQKARKENIENNPEVKPLLQMAYDQVLVSIYMRLKQMNLTVTDQEVREYYEKHKTEREFRALDSVTVKVIAAEKKPEIEAIKKQLVGGAKFDKLAQENQARTIKTTGLAGIEIKDVPAEQLSRKLGAAVAYSMAGTPLNEVKGPQGIPNGWILYKVTARTPGKLIPLEKMAPDLKTMLLRRKRSSINSDLLQEARKEAGVSPDQPGNFPPKQFNKNKNNKPRMAR